MCNNPATDTPVKPPVKPPGITPVSLPDQDEQRRSSVKHYKTGDPFYSSWRWRKLAHRIRAKHHHECLRCREHGRFTRSVLVHHHMPRDAHPELELSEFYTDDDNCKQMNLIPLCFSCHEQIETERGNRSAPVERDALTAERW